jgi:arabinofuranosyltransferase
VVWSTSGLETRQFTFLVVAGVWACGARQTTRARAIAASLLFAAAELTRPEAILVFGCVAAWRLLQDRLAGAPLAANLRWLVLPFAVVVGAHFLLRHAYFGEWLPNPYYAKHVRPWYEAGFPYVAAAAIELGAWLCSRSAS